MYERKTTKQLILSLTSLLFDSYWAEDGRRLSVNFQPQKIKTYKLRMFANKELLPHFMFGLGCGDMEN